MSKMITLKEFRCTRADLYRPGTIGHEHVSARQGHYVWARTTSGAIAKMARAFPKEENFTADATGKTEQAR